MLHSLERYEAYVDQYGILWIEEYHTEFLRLGDQHTSVDCHERRSGYWQNKLYPFVQSLISISKLSAGPSLELLLRDGRAVRLTDNRTETLAENVISAVRTYGGLLIVNQSHQLLLLDNNGTLKNIDSQVKQIEILDSNECCILTVDNKLKILRTEDQSMIPINIPGSVRSARLDSVHADRDGHDPSILMTIITLEGEAWLYNHRENSLQRSGYKQPINVIDSWAYYSIDNNGVLWDMRSGKIVNQTIKFTRFKIEHRALRSCYLIDKNGKSHEFMAYDSYGWPYWPYSDRSSTDLEVLKEWDSIVIV